MKSSLTIIDTDVLVIGSGIAGLQAALTVAGVASVDAIWTDPTEHVRMPKDLPDSGKDKPALKRVELDSDWIAETGHFLDGFEPRVRVVDHPTGGRLQNAGPRVAGSRCIKPRAPRRDKRRDRGPT